MYRREKSFFGPDVALYSDPVSSNVSRLDTAAPCESQDSLVRIHVYDMALGHATSVVGTDCYVCALLR